MLGPGLLESAYQACLEWELRERGLKIGTQVPVPVIYKGIQVECGYRMDLLVEDVVVVELKAAKAPGPIDTAQLITYLRLSGCRVGLLINFHVQVLREGIKRVCI